MHDLNKFDQILNLTHQCQQLFRLKFLQNLLYIKSVINLINLIYLLEIVASAQLSTPDFVLFW